LQREQFAGFHSDAERHRDNERREEDHRVMMSKSKFPRLSRRGRERERIVDWCW
jgi:hypothetical protein